MNVSRRFFPKETGPQALVVTALCLSALWLQGCANPNITLQKLGSGQGIISGFPDSSSCGQSCTGQTTPAGSGAAASVTLSVGQLAGSSVFAGWSGPCDNLGAAVFPPPTNSCTVQMMDTDRKVFAAFLTAAPPTDPVTHLVVTHHLNWSTSGGGSVTSAPAQAGGCGPTCMVFPEGIPVTLTATPPSGSAFLSWTGCDVADGAPGASLGFCTLILTANRTVAAAFSGVFTFAVNLVSSDGGTGSVSLDVPSTPSFSCRGGNGVTCRANLTAGTPYKFRSVTDTSSASGGWTGCPGTVTQESEFVFNCAGTMGSASVTASANFIGTFPLTVTKNGNGTGTVKAWRVSGNPVPIPVAPPDIDCGFSCLAQTGQFSSGTWVFIQAVGQGVAVNPSHNAGWGGACAGTVGDICYVNMSRAAGSVTVTFTHLY